MNLQSIVQQKFKLTAQDAAYLIDKSNPENVCWHWLTQGEHDLFITENGLESYWRREEDEDCDWRLAITFDKWKAKGKRFDPEKDKSEEKKIAEEIAQYSMAEMYESVAPKIGANRIKETVDKAVIKVSRVLFTVIF